MNLVSSCMQEGEWVGMAKEQVYKQVKWSCLFPNKNYLGEKNLPGIHLDLTQENQINYITQSYLGIGGVGRM
jgi:hypothetical protein